MSWYNSSDSSFIDATQTFESGGIIGNNLIVNEGDVKTDNLGFNSTISDLISLKFENGLFNLYLNNKNENGLIFLNTSENDNKIKIENGKLYLYYDYDFTNAPTITSGWTDIINYSTSLQNQIFTLGANVALIDSTLYTPVTGLNVRFPIVEASVATATSINITQDSKITQLELDMNTLITNRPQILEYNIDYDEALDNIRDTMGQNTTAYQNALRDVAVSGGATFNTARSLALSRANFATSFFNSILAGVGGLSFIAGVIFAIYDRLNDRNLIHEEERLLLTYEKIKDNPDSLINNLIHLNGLQINELTNTGFITSEIYDVDINNGGKLKIQIKNINNELKALILDLSTTTTGFNVNDIITIPKTNLGGGTGNLEILVISLVNQKELISEKLDYIYTQKNILKNNDRRRQNIPNKNDFTDGLEIIETTTTEESGEILDKIEIKLKLDQNQFEYDANGNLQVKNYTIISDNASDITTIQNTIGTPEDNKETATIYGNIAKNVYDIDNLETNVFYKGFITDFADTKFQLTPIYDQNNNIINYKLDSLLLENVRDALGTRNPLDTETAFEKIAANKTDINDLRTDLTTQTTRIDDMRLVLGYDDNSILYLLLPKNNIGETPSIEANLTQNKGLLDLGYKTNDLAYNYDDYFDVLFIIPKFNKSIFNTTNEFQENMINNNYILTTNNFSIITDYNNFTSEISGTISFTLPNTDYLGVSFYANLYNQQVLRAILGYKDLSVDMKQDLIVITYTANEVHFRTILDSSFSNNLEIQITGELLLGQNYSVHKLTSDDTLINGIYIINDATENISYSSPYDIFTTSLGLFGGYDIYNTSEIEASNDAFLLYFNDDVIIKDLNIDLTRLWTYSGLAQQPYEPYVKINIYIGNTLQEALDKNTQILTNNFKSLGSTQYQSITSFNIADTNQNVSCKYLYITTEHQPHVRDNNPLKVSFLSINSQYSYNSITYLTQEEVINIPNKECHFVINRDDIAKRLDLYIDGVLTSLYYNLILFTNDYVLTMGNDLGLYTFRMLGVNTTNINPADFDNIKLLNDTTRSVNIDRLTTIEDLYVKDNLVCKNLEVINDNGNVLSFREETSGGRRRGLISDTTYTLLDEVILSTPPTEDAILYYNISTGNIDTRSDVVLNSKLQDYQLKTEAFSGNYSDLNNTPNLTLYQLKTDAFDNDYNSLDNLPNLTLYQLKTDAFSGNYDDLTNKPDLSIYSTFSGNYDDLTNKPDLSIYSTFSGSYTDLTNKPDLSIYSTFSGSYTDLTNKPDLSIYSTFSGSYTDLTNKPDLFSGDYNSLTNKPDLSIYALNSTINNLSIGDINLLQEALNSKAGLDHNHSINNVLGLQSALDGKAPLTHGHEISEIVDLQAKLNEKALITDLNGKADVQHTHLAEDITDLQSKLDQYKLNSVFNQDVADVVRAELPSYMGDYLAYIESTNKIQVSLTHLLENTDYTLIPNLQNAIENAGSGGSGGSSQWTTSGNKIYYNSGNVGIGNGNPYYKLHVKGEYGGMPQNSIAIEADSHSYLWSLSRNTTGTATLGLVTNYNNYNETDGTGYASGLLITYFNQPNFKGATFQIAGDEFFHMNQETNGIYISYKDLYITGNKVEPYNVTQQNILLHLGNAENNLDFKTKGGTVSLYNATNTGGGTFSVDVYNDINLTLEYLDSGFSIRKFNGTELQYIFYIDENICRINNLTLSATAFNPTFDFNIGAFADTLFGTFNRRSDITTDITGEETTFTTKYTIFENAIQVKEIIFTDDPTFKFKSKTELRDAIISLDAGFLEYDANGNLRVTDGASYSDSKVISLLANAFGDYLDFNEENVLGSVNIFQVSQAIDYNNIPNLADAIANSGGGGGVPTGTNNSVLFYDEMLGGLRYDNKIINTTLDFKKRFIGGQGNETYYDLVTIGEDPENPNTGLIDMGFGSIKAYKMNIDDRLDFVKTVVENGQTYNLAGGYIENVWTPEGLFTNFYGQSATFDNAFIYTLTVNNYDVKGTIGQAESAIPTKIAQAAQTTLRRTYGTPLDTEEAVYSTYYNKYTNDIEVYGIIFQDNTYIGSAQDIKDAISLTDYALQTSLNTTNTNVSTNTSDISSLNIRVTTLENANTGDTFVNGNDIITIGDGTAFEIPTIKLLGRNTETTSSRIVFADSYSNTPDYYQGMAIYYDSFNNTLNISGDQDNNQILDAPPNMTFKRDTRYVGIQNINPQYHLDVGGNVNCTGKYYSNGISLNNLVNDNSVDIISHNTRITTLENADLTTYNNGINCSYLNSTDSITSTGGITGSYVSATNISTPAFWAYGDTPDPRIRLNASGEAGICKIELATPFQGSLYNKANVILQAVGRSSYSRSDFVIGVSNVANNSVAYNPNNTSYQRMRIPYDSFTQFYGTYNTGAFYSYYYGYGAAGTYLYTSWNVVTKHNGAIWSTNYIVNSSDRDIKKDIEELNDDECLKKILLLKPSKYRYIDETKNITENKTYGYIAQEVSEVLPEAVRYQAEYIPNALCFVNINNDILTIDSVRPDTFKLVLSVGLKIKLFDDVDNEILAEITEVINENTFKVKEELKYEKLFLYGSLKEDFATLAKEYINAVHVSATQELHRIITKQQEKINELETKLNNVLAHLGL
jgi:hypothetical protein